MNILTEFYLLLKNEETPIFVSEVIEALWPKDKRPQIHKRKKTTDGYTFTIALPPGISFKDFYSKLDYFKDAAGGNKINVSISQSGKMAILQLNQKMLEAYYDYPFDQPAKGILPVPIGYSLDGLQVIDLANHEHILIGGETGSGKTTCLTAIITALRNLEEPPILMIIDLKKSGDYSYLDDSVMLITDRETAGQALDRLTQEMKRRQHILYDAKCKDIKKYNKVGGKMPWLVLIIDELAQLKDPDAQETLEDLLALSRASGFRIIAATQRPSAQIFKKKSFGDAKANFTITICYRTRSAVDSKVILGSGEGATLPKIPGRGILQIGCDMIEIQTPYFDPEGMPNVDQFAPPGVSKKLAINRNADRMGSFRQPTSAAPAVPVRTGSPKKIKSVDRGRNN